MEPIKFTGSIRKAFKALADIIEGKIEGTTLDQKPNWGWDDVHFMIPTKVEPEQDCIQEDDGHGGIEYDWFFTGSRIRSVSFWLTNEFHLATIHLRNEGDEEDRGWEVAWIDTDVEPQMGRRE